MLIKALFMKNKNKLNHIMKCSTNPKNQFLSISQMQPTKLMMKNKIFKKYKKFLKKRKQST